MSIWENQQTEIYERIEIEGKTICLPPPATIPDSRLVGRDNILEKALAAWTSVDNLPPLNFRLYGPPGVGKNAIVYELARILNKKLYIINGHEELGPEDIACTAAISSTNTIEYIASPIFAGMYHGGIVFFDEIGKAPPSALDPLASVLDERRALSSVLSGIHLKAHREFLFCAVLNDIEETGIGLPSFLDERTRPAINVGYPPISEMEVILKSRFSKIGELWVKVFIEEFKDTEISPRTAITLLGYAYKLFNSKKPNMTTPSEIMIRNSLRTLKCEVNLANPDNDPNNNDLFEEPSKEEIPNNESNSNVARNLEESVH